MAGQFEVYGIGGGFMVPDFKFFIDRFVELEFRNQSVNLEFVAAKNIKRVIIDCSITHSYFP